MCRDVLFLPLLPFRLEFLILCILDASAPVGFEDLCRFFLFAPFATVIRVLPLVLDTPIVIVLSAHSSATTSSLRDGNDAPPAFMVCVATSACHAHLHKLARHVGADEIASRYVRGEDVIQGRCRCACDLLSAKGPVGEQEGLVWLETENALFATGNGVAVA